MIRSGAPPTFSIVFEPPIPGTPPAIHAAEPTAAIVAAAVVVSLHIRRGRPLLRRFQLDPSPSIDLSSPKGPYRAAAIVCNEVLWRPYTRGDSPVKDLVRA